MQAQANFSCATMTGDCCHGNIMAGDCCHGNAMTGDCCHG